jgi:ABC-2 type transport system ATP-binding protein
MSNIGEFVVDVKDLSKRYPGQAQPAVDSLSLKLGRGEIFGFVGPNGAGKTTTIKMLLNLVWPDSGGGTILGKDIIRDSVEVRRRVGFMSGEVRLWNAMRGDELLRFLLSLHGGGDRSRVQELCRTFELPLHRKVKTYSSGQKQMLALIAALGHTSRLLVLDEPTKGLDPTRKSELLDLVREQCREGGTAIVSSHVLSEIERICTRVGFIRRGRLLGDDEIDEVRKRLGSIVIASFQGEMDEERLRLPGVIGIRRRRGEFLLRVDGDGREVIRQLTSLPLAGLRYGSASLDELYEELYRDEKEKH